MHKNNINSDPECIHNLAELPEYQATKAKMKKALFAQLTLQKDPRVLGHGDIFDQYDSRRIKEYDDLVKQMDKSLKRQKVKK